MSGELSTFERSAHIAEVCAVDTRTRYSDAELVAFFTRCQRYAMRKLRNEEDAQDFGSWALIAVMEGRPPKVDWLWVDWTRESIGRKGAISQPARIAVRNAISLDAPVSPDSDTPLEQLIAAPSMELDPEAERQKEIAKTAYWAVDMKTRDMIDLWRGGNTQDQIGMIYGVSASRICQKLDRYRLALAKAYVTDLRARAPESIQVDTRLEVQWVTMP